VSTASAPPPGAAAAAPELSVVIVNYNTRALLGTCLAAVRDDSPQLAREVIVVDNGSSDGSADEVARSWPGATLIRNAVNLGYAPACNQGLRRARGRYLLALNSDAFPRRGALAAMVDHLDSHPELSALVPRLENADGSLQATCARRDPTFLSMLLECGSLVPYLSFARAYALRLYPLDAYAQSHEVEILCGACVLYRRSALERVGLLDERLAMNCDDLEWSMRARARGARLGFLAGATVVHVGGQTKLLDPAASTRAGTRAVFVFCDLAFGPVPGLALKLTYALSVGLSLLKSAVLAPFGGAARRRLGERLGLLGACLRLLLRRAGRVPAGEMS
jgi:GT2 family glycosyltransferase